jgi:preprotein translocase subunit SecE
MNKLLSFFREARFFVVDSFKELKDKVTWPKYKELQNSSTLVLIASVIFALVIFMIDKVFENAMNLYYNAF